MRGRASLGDVVDELLREEGLDETHRGDGCGDWREESERVPRGGNGGEMEGWEGAADRGDVAYRLGGDAEVPDETRARHDGGERRGDLFGDERDLGEEADEGDGERGEAHLDVEGFAGESPESLELRGTDDDGQAVDEADHARLRDEAYELAQSERPGDELHETGERDGGEQVLDAVGGDEGGEDDGGGTSRAGDDPRAARPGPPS